MQKMIHHPFLSLVGAGPGDPDLITLKGVKTISNADVVLYDALANPALLDHAPKTALKIFVGKRAGLHEKQQLEINRMIVGYAKSMGHVVRLKGGDPYVFGRGHEELAYANAHDIPGTYIPGISSALAVPGICGIPLTKRQVNESFMVVTGTLKDGSISSDLFLAAQSRATVVVLMGLNKLETITEIFRTFRGEDEPIALIQNGSLPEQKLVLGNLKDILGRQHMEKIGSPALMVIGDVVKELLHPGVSLDRVREVASKATL